MFVAVRCRPVSGFGSFWLVLKLPSPYNFHRYGTHPVGAGYDAEAPISSLGENGEALGCRGKDV